MKRSTSPKKPSTLAIKKTSTPKSIPKKPSIPPKKPLKANHNGVKKEESMEWSFIGMDQLILMMKIHQKIFVFRDIMDLAPLQTSASLREMVITTLKDLQRLYPKIIPIKRMSNVKDKSINQIANEKFDMMEQDSPSMEQDSPSKVYIPSPISDITSSPLTPKSVLPEPMKYNSSPTSCNSTLWSQRMQAVRKLKPIELKRLSYHMSPQLIQTKNTNIEKEPIIDKENYHKVENLEKDTVQKLDKTMLPLSPLPPLPPPPHSPSTTPQLQQSGVVVNMPLPPSPPPAPLFLGLGSAALPPPIPSPPPPMSMNIGSALPPPPRITHGNGAPPPAPLSLGLGPVALPPPVPAPPPLLSMNFGSAPPLPPSMPHENGAPPPAPLSQGLCSAALPPSIPAPPPPLSMKPGSAPAPPPPMPHGNGAPPSAPLSQILCSAALPPLIPAPPPPLSMKPGSAPAPPPPIPRGNGDAAPPPPPLGAGRSLRPKATTKLKRSTQLGNLYRTLKGKVEGSSLNGKSSELIKFHKDVESVLEKLTDESQVLSRFEGFPSRKLEAIRMAAALFNKLDSILNELQNLNIVTPVTQFLDKVERYFNKIKTELDALERTKDEEAKKFKGHNIEFDFHILVKIKEAMVDVSSNCMELALKERRMKNVESNSSSSKDGKRKEYGKLLWRAFQFAFRVYTFAGGHDDRADMLTRELAQEIESDPNQVP
ncbi:hypothetical protein TSUD_386970 [Trifolium subterraneum]|uniref:FH2 domain-containing protein n=1 Tax=Trifolium subterraneum TaxID=3900 RepID=A0A2Z6NU22_TRISU|nr:hypothetical protein TSUD_386970 [Trifolium subterraneum]